MDMAMSQIGTCIAAAGGAGEGASARSFTF